MLLIAYTIESKASKYVNRIVVSADSEEIAAVAGQYGAKILFLRPKEISQSGFTEMQFFEHALNWFSVNENHEPDLIVLLYITSPFRKPESINKAIEEMLKHQEADSLRSVKLCSEHPYKMLVIEYGWLRPFVRDPNIHALSYQLLPTVYIQNASICITKSTTIREKNLQQEI